MTITIKYFASLRDTYGPTDNVILSDNITTIADVMKTLETPLPENTLAAVNHVYAYPDTPVNDGDEVAFFPPVTGG